MSAEASTDTELAAVAAELGLRVDHVLRRTAKSLLATAEMSGRRVIVKMLLARDPFWTAKWHHEIAVYRTFADHPPPVLVPGLVHTDGERLIVLEWLDGRPLGLERYPARPLMDAETDAVLTSVRALNGWSPPEERFVRIFDYRERVLRYGAAGYLDECDREALLRLLDRWAGGLQLNHGDLQASNLLITRDGACALVDWEFTGLFLPGFDLAMLHTLLGARTPFVQDRVDEVVAGEGIQDPFAVNLAMVLTRELRIHRELAEGRERTTRLRLLEDAWERACVRLRRTAGAGR